MSGLLRALALPSLFLLAACDKGSGPPPASTPPATPAAGGSSAPASPSKTAAAPGTPAQPSSTPAGGANTKAAAGLTAAGTAAAAANMQRTPSGLSYAVLQEGQGATPALGSRVKLHYTGWLPGGKVFVDTRETNTPKEFTLSKTDIINGWVEALLTMKKGEKRKLHVPSNLGYGEKGYRPIVPERTDLDFEIELLDFIAPQAK